MNSKYNHYKVTLEHIHNPKGEELHTAIATEFDNHDNIFSIIERLQEKDLFNTKNESSEFAIGLKMLSGVMLRNRENPLFSELTPAFKQFMVKLKSL